MVTGEESNLENMKAMLEKAKQSRDELQKKWFDLENRINDLKKEIQDLDKEESAIITRVIGLFGSRQKDLASDKEEAEVDLKNAEEQVKKAQKDYIAADEKAKKLYVSFKSEQEKVKFIVRESVKNTESEELYFTADKILNTILYLKPGQLSSIKTDKLFDYYKVLVQARDSAGQEYDSCIKDKKDIKDIKVKFDLSEKYIPGSRQLFSMLLQSLPIGFQGLMYLYQNNDFEKIDEFEKLDELLEQIVQATSQKDQEKIIKLQKDLEHQVYVLNYNKISRQLDSRPGFVKLDVDVQGDIIDQHIYIAKLEVDLKQLKSLVDVPFFKQDKYKLQEIESLTAKIDGIKYKLQTNLVNALENNVIHEDYQGKFNKLKSEIDQQEREVRSKIFKDHILDKKLLAGVGGLSIFLGMTGMIVGVTGVAAKAWKESNMAKIPEIERKKAQLNNMLPEDYIFLDKEDEHFEIKPKPEDIPVTDEFLFKKGINIGEDKAKKVADKVFLKPVKEQVEKIEKKFTNVQDSMFCGLKAAAGIPTIGVIIWGGLALTAIATAVAVPPVWPVLAAVGLGGVLGISLGIARANVGGKDSKIIDKIADGLFVPAKPFLQPGLKLLKLVSVTPIKSLIENLKNKHKTHVCLTIAAAGILAVAGSFLVPGLGTIAGLQFGYAVVGGGVGAVVGAFTGLGLGAMYSNVRDAVENLTKEGYVIPEKSKTVLDNLDKDFCQQLVNHFQQRAINLNKKIAKINGFTNFSGFDSSKVAEIKSEIIELERDWKNIIINDDPSVVCKKVNDYVTKRYKVERKSYENVAREHLEQTQVQQKQKRPEDSGPASVDVTYRNIDYRADRKPITELHNLKEQVKVITSKISCNFI